jgi:two-component system LytT family sensor kinase
VAKIFNRSQLFRMLQFMQKPWFVHGVFWVMVFTIMMVSGADNGTTTREVIRKLINLLFYILVVYINLDYLVPKFLNQKNFMTYVLLLLAMVAVLTPIKVMLLYITYEEVDPREFLVMNQHTVFLILFVIAGGSTVIRIISDWQRHQRDRKDLETQRMQSEIKFLKSQINPHFLFNTLNSLYALTLKKSDKAPEIVIKLSEMMRYMLYESNERRVPLQKEVNYIQNYLALEALRQSGHADIQFNVEGQISDQTIAPLIFIPFLENSFKHGLNHQISDGYVYVTMKVLDNRLLLRIQNSKPEHAPQPAEKNSGGIGLANVQRRLNLLYPNQYKLDIEDNDKEHIVELSLALTA